ncbi:hypothetical protein CW304_04330 [Bacillus sp. UFRGS-B20]|nr:hypothetical protein CW304_04330 [Bacillus sp. UFRGS-B20]
MLLPDWFPIDKKPSTTFNSKGWQNRDNIRSLVSQSHKCLAICATANTSTFPIFHCERFSCKFLRYKFLS